MATETRPWTRADLERLPDDGNRYEVLNGALLMTPQPDVPHQGTATALAVLIKSYCMVHGLGNVYAPGAVPHGESELQPDVMVVRDVPVPQPRLWADLPRPSLVIEILSPSTSRRDRTLKRDAYLRWGIPEYWIVDPDQRAVTVIRPGQEDVRVTDTVRWQPRPDLPALEIPLGEIVE